jgi:pyridoxine/pyridoxamine 5'-phosphate oxidase
VNPLTLLADDRAKARAAGDPWANLCVLATVGSDGAAQSRVVVLRDLSDRLAVFINATSPKYSQLSLASRHSVLLYLASLGVQYRLRVAFEPVSSEIVRRSWQDRPRIPKVMDWLYANIQPQSSEIDSREALLAAYGRLDDALPATTDAPEQAVGLYLIVDEVERLELSASQVHSRQRYRIDHDGWRSIELVP